MEGDDGFGEGNYRHSVVGVIEFGWLLWLPLLLVLVVVLVNWVPKCFQP